LRYRYTDSLGTRSRTFRGRAGLAGSRRFRIQSMKRRVALSCSLLSTSRDIAGFNVFCAPAGQIATQYVTWLNCFFENNKHVYKMLNLSLKLSLSVEVGIQMSHSFSNLFRKVVTETRAQTHVHARTHIHTDK